MIHLIICKNYHLLILLKWHLYFEPTEPSKPSRKFSQTPYSTIIQPNNQKLPSNALHSEALVSENWPFNLQNRQALDQGTTILREK
jgi:hypothetical protein